MEESLRLGPWHAEAPAPALDILRILPDGLYASTENMHGVAQADPVPGVVVVDAVEGGDVGDVLMQHEQSGVVAGGRV